VLRISALDGWLTAQQGQNRQPFSKPCMTLESSIIIFSLTFPFSSRSHRNYCE
jgi:hypothetical protein